MENRGKWLRASAIERFEEKYIPEPMSGCFLWTAALKPNGYGMFVSDGRRSYRSRTPQYAHRSSWVLYRGQNTIR